MNGSRSSGRMSIRLTPRDVPRVPAVAPLSPDRVARMERRARLAEAAAAAAAAATVTTTTPTVKHDPTDDHTTHTKHEKSDDSESKQSKEHNDTATSNDSHNSHSKKPGLKIRLKHNRQSGTIEAITTPPTSPLLATPKKSSSRSRRPSKKSKFKLNDDDYSDFDDASVNDKDDDEDDDEVTPARLSQRRTAGKRKTRRSTGADGNDGNEDDGNDENSETKSLSQPQFTQSGRPVRSVARLIMPTPASTRRKRQKVVSITAQNDSDDEHDDIQNNKDGNDDNAMKQGVEDNEKPIGLKLEPHGSQSSTPSSSSSQAPSLVTVRWLFDGVDMFPLCTRTISLSSSQTGQRNERRRLRVTTKDQQKKATSTTPDANGLLLDTSSLIPKVEPVQTATAPITEAKLISYNHDRPNTDASTIAGTSMLADSARSAETTASGGLSSSSSNIIDNAMILISDEDAKQMAAMWENDNGNNEAIVTLPSILSLPMTSSSTLSSLPRNKVANTDGENNDNIALVTFRCNVAAIATMGESG
jgi:hypothetical protein